MARPKTVFFDVGNTLLFPNRTKVLAPLPSERHPTLQQWQALERRTKAEFDQNMQSGRVDHGFWWTFHTLLLSELNGRGDYSQKDLVPTLVRNTQNSSNWDQILPGTRESLDRIAASYRIAVISNSDRGIDKVLSRCGIAECFASITDSGNVGFEKPRREIFDAALETMKASPGECLYVGDVYSVDYLGATKAGMQALLFDVAGAYEGRPEPRVRSLADLEHWLAQR
jgi:HAD superfamily hydrolase (TIGR01509 family)